MALPGIGAEWPGAVSGKFTDKMHGKPTGVKLTHSAAAIGDPSGLAQQGFGNYFTDTRGLGPESCRRIIRCPSSDVQKWRPSRRSLAQPGHDHVERPEGIRKIPLPRGKLYTLPEKRHIGQKDLKEGLCERTESTRVVYRSNGLRAADQPSREVDVASEMQRKARPLSLLEQRNGIEAKSLGDKSYRHPDYAKRFFHDRALVPGSSFARGHHKPHESRSSNSVNLVLNKDVKPLTSYREKMAEHEREELKREVAALTSKFEQITLKKELTEMCSELEEAKAGGKVPDVQYQGGSGLEQMRTYVQEYLDALVDSDDDV